jgi:hypothetical protein
MSTSARSSLSCATSSFAIVFSFQKDVADDTERLIERIAKTARDFNWMRSHEERGVTGNWPDWSELWDKMKDEIPAVRRELEIRFRAHLEPPPPVPTLRQKVAKWLQSDSEPESE